MKNRILYLCLITIAAFLISSGCEKEINENILSERRETTPPSEETGSQSESNTSVTGLGTKLYESPGGGRKYAVSFNLGSKIYLGFGFNHSGPIYDFWECDFEKVYTDWDLTTKNLWTKLPDFPGKISKSGATEGTPIGFAVNGKGYILPGAFWETGKLINEFWEFDPETNSWTQKADPPVALARCFATGFSIGTKLYVGTGETYFENEWKLYNDFWEWDQLTDKWTKKTDFPGESRAHATGFSIGDKGYIGLGGVIGMGGGPVYQDFWEYDLKTDKWARRADFRGSQQIGAIAFSIGNKGYVMAGWDPMSEFTTSQDIWEWNQITDSWTKTGDFAGFPRTASVGGKIGNWGYLLTGQTLSSGSTLSDHWLFDFTPN
jgi:N-acetylneuraminic acid mutarotase